MPFARDQVIHREQPSNSLGEVAWLETAARAQCEIEEQNLASREAEEQFLRYLDLIDRAIDSICRRNGMSREDSEDFRSWSKLKLIENDYAILRKYQQRSKFSTYLVVVIQNLFRDFRVKMWGKWRPSAKARQLGEVAIRLETLTQRDGYGLEEAIEMLLRNFRVKCSRTELIDLAASLPQRSRRVFEGDSSLGQQSVEANAEERLRYVERSAVLERIQVVLNQALGVLAAQDLLVLEMHYVEGLPLSSVARTLHLNQRRLYRRREKCLKRLRTFFERRGLRWQDVRMVLGWEETELQMNFHG